MVDITMIHVKGILVGNFLIFLQKIICCRYLLVSQLDITDYVNGTKLTNESTMTTSYILTTVDPNLCRVVICIL